MKESRLEIRDACDGGVVRQVATRYISKSKKKKKRKKEKEAKPKAWEWGLGGTCAGKGHLTLLAGRRG